MTNMLEATKLLCLGVGAGVLSGLFGIGGGLVIVPALMLILDFDVKMAVGTSLFIILLPTGLLGVIEYWKRGETNLVAGTWVAIGLFVGAYFGGRFAEFFNPLVMRRLYAVFLLVVSIYFLIAPEGAAKRIANRAKPAAVNQQP